MKLVFAIFCVVLAMYPFSACAKTFEEVAAEAQAARAEAERELQRIRQENARARIPVSRKLSVLEDEVLALRKQEEASAEGLRSRKREVDGLKDSLEADTREYESLKAILNAYIVRFSGVVASVELERYREQASAAERIAHDKEATPSQVLAEQVAMLRTSLERVREVIGGARLAGKVSLGEDRTASGNFALVGPYAFFSDGKGLAGIALDEVNASYPVVFDKGFSEEELAGVVALVSQGRGVAPLDASGGDAIKFRAAQDSFVGHLVKGGITMVPLLGLFVVAILVAIFKLFDIRSVQCPSGEVVERIIDLAKKGELESAREWANSVKGPFGELLRAGVSHSRDRKEVLEEALFHQLLSTQPTLERFLSFLALTAAAAPLLGLLGTVTGMIQTFRAINLVGTGDPATLADGISVALVTTEYGLIVAVPCLAAHVLLTRYARGKLDRMERASVAFANGMRTADRGES